MKTIAAAAAAVLLTACAHTAIPRADGTYEVFATGSTETVAMGGVMRSAEKTCADLGKQYVVTDKKIEYRGIYTEAARDTVNQQRAVLAVATKRYIPSVNQPNDYRATLYFSCAG